MTRSSIVTAIVLSVIAPLLIALVISDDPADGATRAVGDDIRMEVSMAFDGPLAYDFEVGYHIYAMSLDGDHLTSDEIRSLYASSPSMVMDGIGEEMIARIGQRIDDAVEGADVAITGNYIDPTSLENSTQNAGRSVDGSMTLSAEMSASTILPGSISGRTTSDRYPFVITSLLLSGFDYGRKFDLTAAPGETVTYFLPSRFDPIGDGSVEVLVAKPGEPVPEDHYVIDLGGGAVSEVETHSFRILTHAGPRPDSQDISGAVLIDILDLGNMTVSSSFEMKAASTSDTPASEDVPPGVGVPDHIGAGTIRYLLVEGLMDLADLDGAVGDLVSDASEDLTDAFGVDVPLEYSIDPRTAGISKPQDGEGLLGIIGSADGLTVSVHTTSSVDTGFTDGHDPAQVKALLDGGLKVRKVFDLNEDGRYMVRVRMPSGMVIEGLDPINNESGRRTYPMPFGITTFASDSAWSPSGRSVSVEGVIDLSEMSSLYLADAALEVAADLSIELSWMELDPGDLEIQTGIDYVLEAASADLIRLCLDMGLVRRGDVEDYMHEAVWDLIGDLIQDKDAVTVAFGDGTLDFDGDLSTMDGGAPITATITIDTTLDPAKAAGGTMAAHGIEEAFLPFHADPIVPIRTYKRSFQLGEARDWYIDIDMTFPSGTGADDGDISQ